LPLEKGAKITKDHILRSCVLFGRLGRLEACHGTFMRPLRRYKALFSTFESLFPIFCKKKPVLEF
jgi:hypothetical protein